MDNSICLRYLVRLRVISEYYRRVPYNRLAIVLEADCSLNPHIVEHLIDHIDLRQLARLNEKTSFIIKSVRLSCTKPCIKTALPNL